MNLAKIFIPVCAIIAVGYFSFVLNEQEKKKRELRKSSEIVFAEILDLRCRKHDFIRFRYKGKEIGKRIYLSREECNELSSKSEIGLKIDNDSNIVFANDNYNDWSEAESFSILGLAGILIFCIIYFRIVPMV